MTECVRKFVAVLGTINSTNIMSTVDVIVYD